MAVAHQDTDLVPLRCPCGKKCFRAALEAIPYIESLAASEHPVRAAKLHSYLCRLCGWIHVGHDFGRASQRQARRGKHARPRSGQGPSRGPV